MEDVTRTTTETPDDRYERLYHEIRRALPADKQILIGQLDTTVGDRMAAAVMDRELYATLLELDA